MTNERPPGDQQHAHRDVRIATIGNVDSGKSTVVGVITSGLLDDGRGCARRNVFNFKHEQEFGRTSSIAHEIVGFDTQGEQVLSRNRRTVSHGPSIATKNAEWGHIVRGSERTVTFMDLCGHERYLRTTIFGLVGCFPDYAMIVVGANVGVQKMTKEHLGIALATQIPFFIVVTKVDMAPTDTFDKNVSELLALLKSKAVKRFPLVVKSLSEVDVAASSLGTDRICPVFCVSNVDGTGLNLLRSFISKVATRVGESPLFKSPSDPVEFYIEGVDNVNGVGAVAHGVIRAGTITVGDQLLLGPDKRGGFRQVVVRSMHMQRVSTQSASTGDSASLCVRPVGRNKEVLKRSNFQKGMVMLDKNSSPKVCWEFEADVFILHHSTTIKRGYQAFIHCGVIRQAAEVLSTSGNKALRTGDKGTIRFRWMYHAEYTHVGMPFLFRESHSKGIGEITHVFRSDSEDVPAAKQRQTPTTASPSDNHLTASST